MVQISDCEYRKKQQKR